MILSHFVILNVLNTLCLPRGEEVSLGRRFGGRRPGRLKLRHSEEEGRNLAEETDQSELSVRLVGMTTHQTTSLLKNILFYCILLFLFYVFYCILFCLINFYFVLFYFLNFIIYLIFCFLFYLIIFILFYFMFFFTYLCFMYVFFLFIFLIFSHVRCTALQFNANFLNDIMSAQFYLSCCFSS